MSGLGTCVGKGKGNFKSQPVLCMHGQLWLCAETKRNKIWLLPQTGERGCHCHRFRISIWWAYDGRAASDSGGSSGGSTGLVGSSEGGLCHMRQCRLLQARCRSRGLRRRPRRFQLILTVSVIGGPSVLQGLGRGEHSFHRSKNTLAIIDLTTCGTNLLTVAPTMSAADLGPCVVSTMSCK